MILRHYEVWYEIQMALTLVYIFLIKAEYIPRRICILNSRCEKGWAKLYANWACSELPGRGGTSALYPQKKKENKTKTMWMFKHMQCPSFDKTCSNAPMDGLRPFLVTVDVSPCVSTPPSRPKPPRYACPVAWAWREKPVRVWGEGRGNPSAVGLTGLAATWSYIYRV